VIPETPREVQLTQKLEAVRQHLLALEASLSAICGAAVSIEAAVSAQRDWVRELLAKWNAL
jgi:vancomycin permeability regulator SanA